MREQPKEGERVKATEDQKFAMFSVIAVRNGLSLDSPSDYVMLYGFWLDGYESACHFEGKE